MESPHGGQAPLRPQRDSAGAASLPAHLRALAADVAELRRLVEAQGLELASLGGRLDRLERDTGARQTMPAPATAGDRRKRRLGRGLDALIPPAPVADQPPAAPGSVSTSMLALLRARPNRGASAPPIGGTERTLA